MQNENWIVCSKRTDIHCKFIPSWNIFFQLILFVSGNTLSSLESFQRRNADEWEQYLPKSPIFYDHKKTGFQVAKIFLSFGNYSDAYLNSQIHEGRYFDN